MKPAKPPMSMSHNVHSVYDAGTRYIWCPPPDQETLLERVCAGAAFVACVTLLIFMG